MSGEDKLKKLKECLKSWKISFEDVGQLTVDEWENMDSSAFGVKETDEPHPYTDPRIMKALKIPGWMSESELSWLADQAQKHSRIVEIGSHLGRSTRSLGDNTPGEVYAIDDWKGPRDVDIPNEERAKIFGKFQENMNGLLHKKVWPFVSNTEESYPTLYDMPSMIFIDGDHEYKSVKRDISWSKSIMPHGLICGHDIERDDVRRAVSEAFPSFSVAPETNIWFVEM